MATNADYTRAIRLTASGQALDRPTRVSALTVTPVDADCMVHLRDGGSSGPILWSAEADNAASSYSINFNPPLLFEHKVYIEFASKGSKSSVCVAVIEPR